MRGRTPMPYTMVINLVLSKNHLNNTWRGEQVGLQATLATTLVYHAHELNLIMTKYKEAAQCHK